MKRIITQLTLLVCLVMASTTARALPFELTADPSSESTQWYYLSNPYGYMSTNLMTNAASPSDADEFKWCFVKKDDSTFYIYNKSNGYWNLSGFSGVINSTTFSFTVDETEDGFYLLEGGGYYVYWYETYQKYARGSKSSADIFRVEKVGGNFPFKLTDDPNASTTQWYNLSIPKGYISDTPKLFSASPSDTDGFKWCFVKRDASSFYIYNKSAGYWGLNNFESAVNAETDYFTAEELENGFYLYLKGVFYVYWYETVKMWVQTGDRPAADVFKVDALERDIDESEVTILKGIRSTGKQCINTGYTHKANTRVQMACNVAKNHDRNWEALFGGRLGSFHHNAFVFFSRTDGQDIPCYNRSGNEPRGSNFAYDQDIYLFCGPVYAEWRKMYAGGSWGEVIASMRHDGTADDGKTPMFLFDLNTANAEGGVQEDNSKSVMTLYGCRFYEGDNLVRDFVPAKYDGVVGLYERKTKRFLTTMTSTPFEAVEDETGAYSVTVNNSSGGVVTLSKNRAKAGEVVDITVTPNDGKVISKLEATTEGGEPVELIPIVGATLGLELLTNGECDGTFDGWEQSSGEGYTWSIDQDEQGNYFWASSYYTCWLRQFINLADKGITADMIDGGGVELIGSAEIKAIWENDGKGSYIAEVGVCMYDANNNMIGTAVILDDTGVFTEWTTFTKKFTLVPGTRELKYQVLGDDSKGWRGNYGPCFRNLSLMYGSGNNSSKYAFEMPADNVNLTVAFSDASAIANVDADVDINSAAIYDMSGRKVNPSQLQRGIYIRNGRKFVIK